MNEKRIGLNEDYKIIDGVSLDEVLEFGYCHWEEVYDNEDGREIKVSVYELEGKTYLMRFVDDNILVFRDITAVNKK